MTVATVTCRIFAIAMFRSWIRGRGESGMLAQQAYPRWIIGGGIAAYKSLDLDPARCRTAARGCAAFSPARRAALRHAARGRRALRRARLYRPVRRAERVRRRPYPPRRDTDLVVVAPATADLMARRWRAATPTTSPPRSCFATDEADPDRAGDEPAHVGGEGDAAQPGAARRPTAVRIVGPNSGEMAERGEARRRADGRSRTKSSPPPTAQSCTGRGTPAGKRVLVTSGPTQRADRSGALHRQPLVRQAGPRHRAATAARRRAAVTLVSGPCESARSARRFRGARSKRARRCCKRWRRRCRPMSPCSPPPSPTGVRRQAERQKIRRQHGSGPLCSARGESRHPRHRSRTASPRRPTPGHRLRGGDRATPGQRRRQSCCRKAATGSSPTTFRRRPASWAATTNTVHLVSAARRRSRGHRSRRRVSRACWSERDRRRAEARSGELQVRVVRLPHSRRPAAAAISKRAGRRPRSPRRGAGRCAGRARAGVTRHDPDRCRDRAACGHRGLCGRARAWPSATGVAALLILPARSMPITAANCR